MGRFAFSADGLRLGQSEPTGAQVLGRAEGKRAKLDTTARLDDNAPGAALVD